MEQVLVAVLPDATEVNEERDLIVRVQAGDQAAFDLLVRRHLPRARLIAKRLMQNPDDAVTSAEVRTKYTPLGSGEAMPNFPALIASATMLPILASERLVP